jgi:cell division protein FtsZ
MSKSGMAIMGIGISTGDNRAIEAAEKAISHPLLEDNSISGAKGVLMNITCNSELTMEEAIEASERIYNEIGDDDVEIIWGTAMDDSLEDEMRITVIATGIGSMDESEMHLPKKSVRQLKDVKRGVVRDYTSEDREYEKNLNQPTFWRVKQQKAEEKQAGRENQKKKAVNSMDDYFDMDMLDVPTFLRRKAD